MINYLFSQVKKNIGFSATQKEYLLKNVDNSMNITFIASVPDNYERTDEQVNRFNSFFSKIGISFNSINFIDGRKTKEEAKKSVENSDVVFLLGGSPDLQMKFINDYELSDLISNVKIVIGVSAGSMNQGDRVIYKDDFENYILKDYKGLNLTDINIFPHYDIENIECVNEVEEVSNIHPIICLPNESFVYIENGKKEIIGEYYDTLLRDNKLKQK